ncbi:MAG: SPOR domain-containing protein [Calditrichaeota bacterium]|nr:MAG: SPOR domain-containing protein [Calditrichota bacterium]
MSELLQKIGKTLVWLGILCFAIFFYKFGSADGFSKITQLPTVIANFFKGTVAPSGIPVVSSYRILVGTYDSNAAALEAQNRLKSKRINSQIVIQNRKYYIMVGNYTNKSQAEGALKQLQSKGVRGVLLTPARTP